jgi:hypothetical protein
MKTQKRKWYYWDVFNQCWMRNGEGVRNWKLQGFTVKLLPLLLLVLSSFVAMGQTKIDSAIAHDPKWQGIQSTANSHEPFEGINGTSNLFLGTPTHVHYYFFEAVKTETIMSVSAPDSNKMITVKLNPKLVKFINDSTFVFKQP